MLIKVPTSYPTPSSWYIRVPFTNIALLFLVCTVLDSGLSGFSVVISFCRLTFLITDNRANGAHFQRRGFFLSTDLYLPFDIFFLPDRVVRFFCYFGMAPLTIL